MDATLASLCKRNTEQCLLGQFLRRNTHTSPVRNLASLFMPSNALRNDIDCLKSIKDSLEDPLGYLSSSWDFNNATEGFICRFVGVDCWHAYENKALNIRLSNMGLKGQFPRGLEKCSSLTGLDLSSNELSGVIPWDICRMIPFLTSLDLSSNLFSGEIPPNFANCSYLNVLKLDSNQLTGRIPQQLDQLSRIKNFSVANNMLSGPLPNFAHSIFTTAESFANNSGLCGPPLKQLCQSSSKRKSGLTNDERSFFIGGFLVGWATFTILVFYVSLLCTPTIPTIKSMIRNMIMKGARGPCSRSQTQTTMDLDRKISKLEKFVTRMSFVELAKATDNFSENNVVGIGKIGNTYKAMLPNGWFLAIKRLRDSEHVGEHFVSEVRILGRLRHSSLVPLLGFSHEKKERLLVYKYMSNGSLHDWLHPIPGRGKITEWHLRAKIAVGIARGLVWLHHYCNLVHCNISARCILLDKNFEPKISNFWEAKFMNPNDASLSWSSFSNDEFCWELVCNKRDVHSYGILLLELITGKEPGQVINSSGKLNVKLAEWITHLSNIPSDRCHQYHDNVDRCIIGQGFDGEIYQFLKIAFDCTLPFPDQRPTMLEVYQRIRATGGRDEPSDGFEILHPSCFL